MLARYIRSKNGQETLDDKTGCPFTAETPNEEALLFYLRRICNAVEDLEAATSGDLDNVVATALDRLLGPISTKLDEIIDEVRLTSIMGGPN